MKAEFSFVLLFLWLLIFKQERCFRIGEFSFYSECFGFLSHGGVRMDFLSFGVLCGDVTWKFDLNFLDFFLQEVHSIDVLDFLELYFIFYLTYNRLINVRQN